MFPLKDDIPTTRFPVVTVALIAINVIVYLLLQQKTGGGIGIDLSGNSLDPSALGDYAAIPYEISHPGDHCDYIAQAGQYACQGMAGVSGEASNQLPTWATAFTAMFSHAGLLHLGGNMLFLWIFGNNVEDSMGRVRYLAFYLLCGLGALAAQVLVEPNAAVPTLGASGAVAGVLAGYLVLYPRAKVLTAVFIVIFFAFIRIPAFLFLLVWIGQQVLFGYFDLTAPEGGGGGVAYFAHIGGFVVGLALIKLFAQRRNPYADAPRIPVH